jgi:hypothetical protein
MRIFVHNVDTFLGKALVAELLRVEASNEDNTSKHRIFGTFRGKTDEDVPKVVKRSLQAISAAGGAPDPKRYKKLSETIASCTLVILDLYSCTLDDLYFAISSLKVDPKSDPPRTIGEPLGKEITVILISSAMVWAGTQRSPGAPSLTDADYKSRSPLPGSRYEQWREMEDLVMNCFNREESTIKGLVVAPGVLYGDGEDTFGLLFKSAWLGEKQTFVDGQGSNRVPAVHVRDLARAVREVGILGNNAKGEPITTANLLSGEERPYFLVFDQPTMKEVAAPEAAPVPAAVEAGGAAVAAPEATEEPAEAADAAAVDGAAEAEQAEDQVAEEAEVEAEVNTADPADAGEEAGEPPPPPPPKIAPSSQTEILQGIVDEFSDAFSLIPASADAGKDAADAISRLQEAVSLDLAIDTSELFLKDDFAQTCNPPGWWCKKGLIENLPKVAAEFCKERGLRPMLAIIAGPPGSGKALVAEAVAKHYNVAHYSLPNEPSDEDLAEMIKKLSSKVCRYRGYVLDVGSAGSAEMEKLFTEQRLKPKGDDEEEPPPPEEGEEPPPPVYETVVNEKLCPEFAIVTQAPEEFCRAKWRHEKRNMDEFQKQMDVYKKNNYQSNGLSLTDFFQETARRAVMNLPIAGKDPEDTFESVRIYMDGSKKGRPFNYLRSEEEIAQELLQAKAEHAAKVAHDEAERLRVLKEDRHEELEDQRKSKLRLDIIAKHEEAQKQLQAMPLRAYLMEHMVPSLTEGLIELCKVLPEDPVDYLATYLENHTDGASSTENARH